MNEQQIEVSGSSSAAAPSSGQAPASSLGATEWALDAFTILKSTTGSASKRIIRQADGSVLIEGFSAGKHFHVFEAKVRDIVGLSAMLATVEAQPDCLVIRGAPRADLNVALPQQRLKTNFHTPAAGRQYVLLDFDKITLPEGLSLQQDVRAVCEHLTSLLPGEFHAVSYHWQLSSRAGITDPSLVSLHLWFWLDRPVPDAQLKAWSIWWNDEAGTQIIDWRLFNGVQAHYTAAPVFVGMANPFPVRSGLVRKAVDEVALRLPRPQTSPRPRTMSADAPLVQSSSGFEGFLAQIGDHPGGRGFHDPFIRAVASYVATHGREGTNVEALYEVVRARLLAADRSNHDDTYVEKMASREHIIPAIEQAIGKFGAPSPRRKTRQISGVRPHFTSKPVSAEEGSARLQKLVHGFFGRPS